MIKRIFKKIFSRCDNHKWERVEDCIICINCNKVKIKNIK